MEWLWIGAITVWFVVLFRNWWRREDRRINRKLYGLSPSAGESKAEGSVSLASERKAETEDDRKAEGRP